MPRPIDLVVASLALATLGALPLSCTVFDGLAPSTGYFDAQGASRLCARMMACPTLAPSIRASLGVPADDASFSACVDWMAGPVPGPQSMLLAAREMLTKMADASSCAEALPLAYVEALPEGDRRCDAELDTCVGDDVLDCDAHTVVHCQSALFQKGSRCASGDASTGVAHCSAEPFEGAPPPPSCKGSILEVFDARTSQVQRLPCETLGLACVPAHVGPNGMIEAAACAPSADDDNVCSAGVPPDSCANGTSIVFCNRNEDVDIAIFGMKSIPVRFSLLQSVYTCPDTAPCVPASSDEGTSLAHCRGHHAECTAKDAKALPCEGTSVTVCLDGRLHTLDCAEGGMECRDSAAVGAHCAFPSDPRR